MKKAIAAAVLFIVTIQLSAQDMKYARHIVDTLTTEVFWGRGYTKDGMGKAAVYLAEQFKTLGLQPMKGANYYQHFNYPVNTFPGAMQLSIAGESLVPGQDFIISPESRGIKCKGVAEKRDSVTWFDAENRVAFVLANKLTWSVAREAENYTLIELHKDRLTKRSYRYEINVENSMERKFIATNICAMVKGTEQPDSLIVFTAHYDHLGGMGADTYFPGANDNASGVALLLNLAKYYAQNPSRYSVAFILFAGEEIGLLGSKYFTEHPLIELKNIRFLLNTDLAGTGEEGITVINATIHPMEYDLMKSINEEKQLLKTVASRGKAMNSDHHWFTELGVPAFFFFTMGGIQAYHDVYDKAETLPLNEHEDLFRLLVEFCGRLTR